jgi:hypothetical protein
MRFPYFAQMVIDKLMTIRRTISKKVSLIFMPDVVSSRLTKVTILPHQPRSSISVPVIPNPFLLSPTFTGITSTDRTPFPDEQSV